MPDFTLSDALREAYASAPADVIHDTIELRHPAFDAPIRVVCGHAALTATLEADAPANPGEAVEFAAYAFDFTLPEVSQSALPEIELIIDNVGREISDNINAALETTDKIEVTYRPYLASDLSAPQADPPPTYTVRSIRANLMRVTGRAGFGDFGNKLYPGEVYTLARFPGLRG